MKNLIPYKTDSGCLLSLVDFFELKGKGVVFTGTLLEVPGGHKKMDSREISNLLKGQLLFGRPIEGVELWAIPTQHIPVSVGLLVKMKSE